MLTKLNNCKDKVIKDHAFCPDCVNFFCTADGASYSAPSTAVALPQWVSPTPSSSYVSVRTTAYAIDDWPSSPGETGKGAENFDVRLGFAACYGAAQNFYRNFDSIQYQLAAPATQGLQVNYTSV